MNATEEFDVIVVGASLAGCTAAILLARGGLKVALIDRHDKVDSYKHLCTHFIQASALPVLRRLGLDRLIEEAGGVRNSVEVHTPYGWIGDHLGNDENQQPLHGYNIRRSRLDPMMRHLAEGTPGVTMMVGWSARALIEQGHRIVGVEAVCGDLQKNFRARLVVAADGRNCPLATLAGVKPKSSPNRRFAIFAPMRHVDLRRGDTSQMWLTGPEAAYVFPNDDGVTMLAWVAPQEFCDASREQPLETLTTHLRSFPDAPQLHNAELADRLLVLKDYPNLWRPPVVRGMALVGDAAMSIDYVWGTGCGWAFQSAEWLADAVLAAEQQNTSLDLALRQYRRKSRALTGHRFIINDFSRRLSLNFIERLIFSAAVKDVGMARRMNRFGARIDGPMTFLSPLNLLKALWINLRRPVTGQDGTRSAAEPDEMLEHSTT